MLKYLIGLFSAAILALLPMRPTWAAQSDQDFVTFDVQPTWVEFRGTRIIRRQAVPLGAVAIQDGAHPLSIEAEQPLETQIQSGHESSVGSAEDASNGRYLAYIKHTIYVVSVKHAGQYRLWYRVQRPFKATWNVTTEINGHTLPDVWFQGDDPVEQWYWKGADPVDLGVGDCSIDITGTINGLKIDKLVLLPADAPAPVDQGPPASLKRHEASAAIYSLPLALSPQAQWRLSDTARQLGMQYALPGHGTWLSDAPQSWQSGAARFRLSSTGDPLPLDQALVEVRWPRSQLKALRAGKGTLWFHPADARIVGMTDSAIVQANLPSTPIFSVGWWDQHNVEHTLSDDGWVWRRDRSNGDTFVYVHKDLPVTLTLRVESTPTQMLLHLETSNASDVRLSSIAFPILPPAVTRTFKGNELIFPGVISQRIADPESMNRHEIPYPRAAMNWMALSCDGGALYLAGYDPQLRMNNLVASPTRSRSGLILQTQLLASVAPGDKTRQTAAVALVDGNWRQAAVIYRDWFRKQFGMPKLPRWITHGHGLYAIMSQNRPAGFYGQREDEIDAPWWFGMDLAQIWGHGPMVQCCPEYYYPDPARGGEQAFVPFLQRLKAAGLRVGTYFHGHAINPLFSLASRFRGTERSSLPPELRHPDFKWFQDNVLYEKPGMTPQDIKPPAPELVKVMEAQTGRPDDLAKHKVARLFIDMSWGKGFQDYLHFWLGRYMRTYGINVPYLDVWGFRPKSRDFNPAAGFGAGDQGGRMLKMIDWLCQLGRQTEGDRFAYLYEGYTDVWALRGSGLTSGFSNTRQPEVIEYTFPRHVLMRGMHNGNWDPPKSIQSLGHSFADGNIMELLGAEGSLSGFAWMREAIRDWLPATDYMLDDGVVAASKGFVVRQHLGKDFALWNWFDSQARGGSLHLAVPNSIKGKTVRWFSLSADGSAAAYKHQGDAIQLDTPAAYVGTVVAVWGKNLPASQMTLVRVRPNINSAEFLCSTLNPTDAPQNIHYQLTEFGSGRLLAEKTQKLPAFSAQNTTLSVATVGELPVRTLVYIAREDRPRRRLAPVPVADPMLRHRTHIVAYAPHPDDPSRGALALKDPTPRVSRRIYWPADKSGEVRIHLRQSAGGRLLAVLSDPDQNKKVLRQKPADKDQSGWTTLTVPFKGNGRWLRIDLVNRNAATPDSVVWIDEIKVVSSK